MSTSVEPIKNNQQDSDVIDAAAEIQQDLDAISANLARLNITSYVGRALFVVFFLFHLGSYLIFLPEGGGAMIFMVPIFLLIYWAVTRLIRSKGVNITSLGDFKRLKWPLRFVMVNAIIFGLFFLLLLLIVSNMGVNGQQDGISFLIGVFSAAFCILFLVQYCLARTISSVIQDIAVPVNTAATRNAVLISDLFVITAILMLLNAVVLAYSRFSIPSRVVSDVIGPMVQSSEWSNVIVTMTSSEMFDELIVMAMIQWIRLYYTLLFILPIGCCELLIAARRIEKSMKLTRIKRTICLSFCIATAVLLFSGFAYLHGVFHSLAFVSSSIVSISVIVLSIRIISLLKIVASER